jgi:arginyl-tRNA--protein-N-Asp/Glu arginylyltransferase
MPEEPDFHLQEEDKPLFIVSAQQSFKGAALDAELARGFYRMHQYMFTCYEVPFENGAVHPVFWLRYLVDKWQLSGTQKKLIKQAETKFEVLPAASFTNNREYEELYQRYRKAMDFNCAEYLDDTVGNQLMKFDSKVIEVREGGELIAAGIFDQGIEAIAGIVNYYDPVYSKYSLGKTMVPLKYLYCREQGLKYYYPGYISPSYPKFDYKKEVNADAIEVYMPERDEWVGYGEFVRWFS